MYRLLIKSMTGNNSLNCNQSIYSDSNILIWTKVIFLRTATICPFDLLINYSVVRYEFANDLINGDVFHLKGFGDLQDVGLFLLLEKNVSDSSTCKTPV